MHTQWEGYGGAGSRRQEEGRGLTEHALRARGGRGLQSKGDSGGLARAGGSTGCCQGAAGLTGAWAPRRKQPDPEGPSPSVATGDRDGGYKATGLGYPKPRNTPATVGPRASKISKEPALVNGPRRTPVPSRYDAQGGAGRDGAGTSQP